MTAKYTVQCTHPDTGETGCWLFAGESHRQPGSALCPVMPDLLALFRWMHQNGWRTLDGWRAEKAA